MNNLNIMADASLPNLELCFPPPFKITLYNTLDEIKLYSHNHSILLCRSTLQVNEQLFGSHHIQCVATASSGTDHIDTDFLQKKQITLFDAKGSNAHAVADYVLSCIACVQKHGLLTGRRAAVVGAGHVGSQVGMVLRLIGFEVVWIDPLNNLNIPGYMSAELSELGKCDLICVHAHLHDTDPFPSKNLFNQALFSQLKPSAVIINAARGGIVNESDLLKTPQSMIYCTDVYNHEPNPSAAIIDRAMLCTPHIAGHSIEAKQRAIQQISAALHQHYGIQNPLQHAGFSHKHTPKIPANWAMQILEHYNPSIETDKLKKSKNKMDVFIQQRNAHIYRHETQW